MITAQGTGSSGQQEIPHKALAKAADIIQQGGVVAFPTETFYGLAVDPMNPAALKRLFKIKKRSYDKPVLILVDEESKLAELASAIPNQYQALIRSFWPGPLTLIFPGLALLPPLLTGNTPTVGVRISSHPIACRLLKAVGSPITATSANMSGEPAAVSASEVQEQLGRKVDLVLDGGKVPGGKGSTIVGIEGAGLKLIRDGVIPYDRILAA